jgi:hypothetical protein
MGDQVNGPGANAVAGGITALLILLTVVLLVLVLSGRT